MCRHKVVLAWEFILPLRCQAPAAQDDKDCVKGTYHRAIKLIPGRKWSQHGLDIGSSIHFTPFLKHLFAWIGDLIPQSPLSLLAYSDGLQDRVWLSSLVISMWHSGNQWSLNEQVSEQQRKKWVSVVIIRTKGKWETRAEAWDDVVLSSEQLRNSNAAIEVHGPKDPRDAEGGQHPVRSPLPTYSRGQPRVNQEPCPSWLCPGEGHISPD